MNSQDQDKFKSLITVISETYNDTFTASKTKLWWNIFKPYSVNDFEKALYSHISCTDNGFYSPKPAHIIRQIEGGQKENSDVLLLQGSSAWAHIEQSIRNGARIDPELIEAVDLIGGMQGLKELDSKDMRWARKDFMQVFAALGRHEAKKSKDAKLIDQLSKKAITND